MNISVFTLHSNDKRKVNSMSIDAKVFLFLEKNFNDEKINVLEEYCGQFKAVISFSLLTDMPLICGLLFDRINNALNFNENL
jgi:hypothetical protein